ncbi:MAG: ATP-binding domain-containing protein, partial [Gammaproteobacteria bacterium]|nr:ATP-binding domain-containing protein [Gammaproteobacteria bacterium]
MIPLRPSGAKTVHRSQGSTYKKVVIDFTNATGKNHLVYVAISRVTKLSGLFLVGFKEKLITVSSFV